MAEEVRQRKPATAAANGSATAQTSRSPGPNISAQEESPTTLGILDILRLALGLFLLSSLLSYFITNDSILWGYRPWFTRPSVISRWWQGPIYLTDAELAAYDGSDPSKPVYLALNGTIYDVSAGRRIYGPGGSYNVFAGKDAARGFITGCFAEDSTPDLRGAEWTYIPQDVPAPGTEGLTGEEKNYRAQEVRKAQKMVRDTIDGWAKMFRGEQGKDYFEVGKVVREEGWLERLEPRGLCAQAENGRPKSKRQKARDAGAEHRGG